jgi:hypothetical protein
MINLSKKEAVWQKFSHGKSLTLFGKRLSLWYQHRSEIQTRRINVSPVEEESPYHLVKYSRVSFTCCERAVNGKRFPKMNLEAQVPFTLISCDGCALVSLLPCGERDWPNTTIWRGSLGDGKV